MNIESDSDLYPQKFAERAVPMVLLLTKHTKQRVLIVPRNGVTAAGEAEGHLFWFSKFNEEKKGREALNPV